MDDELKIKMYLTAAISPDLLQPFYAYPNNFVLPYIESYHKFRLINYEELG